MRALTTLGVSLLLVGTLVIIAPSGAFESLSAERGVGVETAAEEGDALLGLESNYDGTQIQYESGGWFGSDTDVSAEVATVANNADVEWTAVSVEVDSVTWADRSSDRILRVADAPDALSPTETGAIELECSRAVTGNANDATVALDITADGSDAPVSVDRRAFPVSGVAFDCEGEDDPGTAPPTDPIPIADIDELQLDGTPTAEQGPLTSQTSRVTFGLEYTGDQSVTVTTAQIKSTSSTATRVETILSNDPEIDISATADGYFDAEQGITIGNTAYPLEQDATLGSGTSAEITLQEFREGGEWTRVSMSGETVTVVFTVEGLDSSDPDATVPVEIELDIE